ncbi:hypothetical protein pb186bvf_018176 [Paramecium bursaria]
MDVILSDSYQILYIVHMKTSFREALIVNSIIINLLNIGIHQLLEAFKKQQ